MENTDQKANHSQQQQQQQQSQSNTTSQFQQYGQYAPSPQQQGGVPHPHHQQQMLFLQQSQPQLFHQQHVLPPDGCHDPSLHQGQGYAPRQGYPHQYPQQADRSMPQDSQEIGYQHQYQPYVQSPGISQAPSPAFGHQQEQQHRQQQLQNQQFQPQYYDPNQLLNCPRPYPQPSHPQPGSQYGHSLPYSIPGVSGALQIQSDLVPINQGYPGYADGGKSTADHHYQHERNESLPISDQQCFASERKSPTLEAEKDELRLHLANLGPRTSEDTLENFLESCAETDVEGFVWAANKKFIVVTFKTKPDVSSIMNACQRKSIEGHHIEVKTVPRSKCLKVTGFLPDSTEDSVRYYFENKKRGGPIEDLQLFPEKQTAFVRFEQYGVAEKLLLIPSHTLGGCTLSVSIIPDLPEFMTVSDKSDTLRSVQTESEQKSSEATEIDEKKILVVDLGNKISEDTLSNFLESNADAEVSEVQWGENRTSALVSFNSPPDVTAVKRVCGERKVNGQKLEIRTVNRTKCVKVTGLPNDITEDGVHYFFENKKRGGPVDDVELYRETNSALVRFEQYGDAEKVCSSSHKLREHVLTVTMYTDTPDFVPMEKTESRGRSTGLGVSQMTPTVTEDNLDDKLLVKNINPKTVEDTLRNFLEAKADADVQGFEWGNGKTAAVVTFGTEPDVKALIKGCGDKRVDGQKIEIQRVYKSKSVKVTGLSPDTTEDTVRYYFENKKRGGPVDEVELEPGTNSAIVRFEQYGNVEKACSASHKLCKRSLTVKTHMDIPGFVPLGQEGQVKERLPTETPQAQPAGGHISDDLIEQLQLLIKNINPMTSEDVLMNFLEPKTNADVKTCEWGKGSTSAVITFDTKPDIAKLKAACKNKTIEKHNLTVECVPKSRSLKVTGLADNISEDRIRYYFENKKRCGGGPVDYLDLQSDSNTAIIQFEEMGVAERVCSRQHSVADKAVTVIMHHDIPGFVSAKDDSEEAGDSSTDLRREPLPVTKPSEQTLKTRWAHIVKDIPVVLLRFLNKSDEEKRKLQEDVQIIDGKTRFIQQPNGMILEVSYTGDADAGMAEKSAWVKHVDSIVKKSIGDMDLSFQVIDIPEGLPMEQVNVLLQERADELQVRQYLLEQKLYIVGHRSKVEIAVTSVKELFVSFGPKVTESFDVKTFQIQYLKLSDFISLCNQRYPSVNVHLKSQENQVVLEGPKEYLKVVKLFILQMFNSLKTDHFTFKTDLAVGILKSSLSDKLQDANINCVWEEESQSKIKLLSENEDEIKKARDLIKQTICEEVIELDRSAAGNLRTAEWRETRRSLVEANQGRLMISEDSDVVTVAADSDIFQRILTEIDKFFKISTIRHITLSADVPSVKFLKNHALDKVKRIQQNLISENVSIEFEEGSYSCGVKISGLNEGIAKAKKEVKKLLDKVSCEEVKLALPGINDFFKKGKGREMVTAIELNTHTVIRPKERQIKTKSVKSWTTSAGVVSVVKGDMCQLRLDAIAFTDNKDLKLVGGLGKAIAEKGGKEIQEEADKIIKKKGRLSDGAVVCTGSGRLPCKFLLHAVLPKWQRSSHGVKDPLKTVVVKILKECDKKHVKSVALPALGTGQGYPLLDAVKVIVETLHEQWGEGEGTSVQEVILCDIKQATVSHFVKTCDSVFTETRPRLQPEGEGEDEDDVSDNKSERASESEAESKSESESDGDDASDSDELPKSVHVIVGELSTQKADVLVNPTGKELNMSVGAVSKSLSEAGGQAIQAECKEKYPAGLKVGKIAVTTGGKLSCKKILHGILQQWNRGQDASDLVLKTMVFKCLKEADVQGLTSIALPALGTGKLGFPPEVSAKLMFQAATSFLKNNPETSVKSILFVVHPKDIAVRKAFEGKRPSQGSDHTSYRGARQQEFRSRRFKGDNEDNERKGDYREPYKRGSVKVNVLKGDLTREKTDCIICCCDENFDLKHGALSKAILAQAGSELQKECSSKKDDLVTTGIAVTDGYNLSCKNVIHLKVQKSPRDWGTLLIECFEEAESMGMTSLSLPALGTGGQKMSPEKMASSLLYAVNRFADRHSHSTLTLIRVVIFQGPMVSTYKTVFAGGKPRTGGRPEERHGHRHRGDHRSGASGNFHADHKAEDQIILCIFSDSRDNIDKAKDRIQALCKDEFVQKHIGDRFASKIGKLDDAEMSYLHGIASKHRVVLNRNKSELVLTGMVKDVSEVKEQIISKFQDDTISKHMKEEAQMVAKLVQWSYIVDDTTKPFTLGLNCCLEKAYTRKAKTIDIKDPKGNSYTVDFDQMTESPKAGGGSIKIVRFEKAIQAGLSNMLKGEKEALAGTTTVYFPLEPERNFKGNAEDLHFRTAESQFYRLLSGHSAQYKVSKVEYVVTPHLVKKFQSAQEDLKKSSGEMYAQPLLAFHGTNVNNITSICEKGFLKSGDPGFQMKSGNAFGNGVYFSEFPDYSMSYISGATKLLLCKVLLGKTWTVSGSMGGGVQPGYDSHTSPNGKELVIFDTSRILPCYIVHYK